MNTQREYVGPINISYVYAGGTEGTTSVSWLRERRHNNNEFEVLHTLIRMCRESTKFGLSDVAWRTVYVSALCWRSRAANKDTNHTSKGRWCVRPYIFIRHRQARNSCPLSGENGIFRWRLHVSKSLNSQAEVNCHMKFILEGIRVTFPVKCAEGTRDDSKRAIVCTKNHLEVRYWILSEIYMEYGGIHPSLQWTLHWLGSGQQRAANHKLPFQFRPYEGKSFYSDSVLAQLLIYVSVSGQSKAKISGPISHHYNK